MTRWIGPTLLALLLFSCKTKPLEYLSFDRFRVTKLGFPNSVISLDVTTYNPNKFGLKLTKLESDVFVNQEFLGKAFIDSTVLVPGRDTFVIPVKMDVKMGGTMNSLMQMIANKEDSTVLNIKLDGKAQVRKSGLQLSYPILYEDRKTIRF